jgi:hypothetical protein
MTRHEQSETTKQRTRNDHIVDLDEYSDRGWVPLSGRARIAVPY